MAKDTIVMEARSIVKMFGGLPAIDKVTIKLKENEILGLIGPNGAGKTTMFNMISGSLPMTSGEIFLGGKKIENVKAHHMARLGIGRTYQVVQPFSNLTVLENTMVGCFLRTSDSAKARQEARLILEKVELDHKCDTLGKDLSLIDLKRMEIARALGTNPYILLLDEVMAGLNPAGSDKVMDMIRGIQRDGMSIIIIEHVMKAVMGLCERIYVLNRGQLIAEGLPEEISRNQQVIESYLGVKRNA